MVEKCTFERVDHPAVDQVSRNRVETGHDSTADARVWIRRGFEESRNRIVCADAAKRPANHLVQHRDDEESCQSGYYDYPQPLWTREQCGDVGDEAEIPIQIDLTTVER